MKEVLAYKVSWNVEVDQGIFLLDLKNEEGVRQLLVDSAAEASLLIDILRNEKPVYVDSNNLLLSGFEMVGEGERGNDEEE